MTVIRKIHLNHSHNFFTVHINNFKITQATLKITFCFDNLCKHLVDTWVISCQKIDVQIRIPIRLVSNQSLRCYSPEVGCSSQFMALLIMKELFFLVNDFYLAGLH